MVEATDSLSLLRYVLDTQLYFIDYLNSILLQCFKPQLLFSLSNEVLDEQPDVQRQATVRHGREVVLRVPFVCWGKYVQSWIYPRPRERIRIVVEERIVAHSVERLLLLL